MPYRRRRRRYRRRPRAKKAIDRYQNAKIKKLFKLTKPELKFTDRYAQMSITDIWSSPFAVSLTNIRQGDGVSQRVGNTVKVKSIQLKCFLTSEVNDSNLVRLLVYRVPARFAPQQVAIENVIEKTINQGASTYEALLSPYKKNSGMNFQVLHDKMYNLISTPAQGASTVVYTNTTKKCFTINVGSKSGWTTKYALDTDTEPDLGSIWMVALSDSSAVSLNHPTIETYVRLNYTDS